MSDNPSRGEVDAKIEAAEARTDAKFAELLGEVKAINIHLSHIGADLAEVKESRRSLTVTVIGTGIGAVAIVIAVLAYGSTWFDLGINAQEVAAKAAKEAIEQYRRTEQLTAPLRPPTEK